MDKKMAEQTRAMIQVIRVSETKNLKNKIRIRTITQIR